jgi:hypothetical protein
MPPDPVKRRAGLAQGDFGLSMIGVNSGYPRLDFWEPWGSSLGGGSGG